MKRSRAGRLRCTGFCLLLFLLPAWSGFVAAREIPADTQSSLRLAVLPADDLSEGLADLGAVNAVLESRIAALNGFEVIPPDEMLSFLQRHRMRSTGGIRFELLQVMRDELGADAALVCSVDLFVEGPPPRVALTARIVDVPAGGILWAGEAGQAGEQKPGLLGLGEIVDVGDLLERTADRLFGELSGPVIRSRARTRASWKHPAPAKRYSPKKFFSSPELSRSRTRLPRVAVLPFENRSPGTDTGGAIAGLLATHLAGREQLELIEPGEVRHMLLQGRIIQLSGLSLAQADFLREMLDVDLVVTGEILEFADRGRSATPEVAFSIWVVDVRRREVVWSGYSANRGDDGVVFFDIGRAITARELLSRMVRSAASEIVRAIPTVGAVDPPDPALPED